jgi:hypothetical protein
MIKASVFFAPAMLVSGKLVVRKSRPLDAE